MLLNVLDGGHLIIDEFCKKDVSGEFFNIFPTSKLLTPKEDLKEC
jgi:hypothetical protein